MLFRKSLIRIRAEYNRNPRRLFAYSWGATLVCVLLTLAADLFIPFGGAWNVIRTVILVPSCVSFFVAAYALSLFFHYSRKRSDPNWVPFRSRLSPMWRRRVAMVIGAIMLVLVYANGFRVGYTLISSITVSMVIALFAFIRTTREEANREEFNIPDARDTTYQRRAQEAEAAREAARRARIERRKTGSKKVADKKKATSNEGGN